MDDTDKPGDEEGSPSSSAKSTLGGAVAGAVAGTALGVPVVGTVIGAVSGAVMAARKRRRVKKKAAANENGSHRRQKEGPGESLRTQKEGCPKEKGSRAKESQAGESLRTQKEGCPKEKGGRVEGSEAGESQGQSEGASEKSQATRQASVADLALRQLRLVAQKDATSISGLPWKVCHAGLMPARFRRRGGRAGPGHGAAVTYTSFRIVSRSPSASSGRSSA